MPDALRELLGQSNYFFPPAPVVSVPVLGTNAVFPVRRVYCIGQNYSNSLVAPPSGSREEQRRAIGSYWEVGMTHALLLAGTQPPAQTAFPSWSTIAAPRGWLEHRMLPRWSVTQPPGPQRSSP